MRKLSGPGHQTRALIRSNTADIRQTRNAAVVVINPDLERPRRFACRSLRCRPPPAPRLLPTKFSTARAMRAIS